MLLLSLLLACESEPTVDETTTSSVSVEESKIEATTSEVTNTAKGETTSEAVTATTTENIEGKTVSEDESTSTESE